MPNHEKRVQRTTKKVHKAPFIKPTQKELNTKIWAGIVCVIIALYLLNFQKGFEFIAWLLLAFGFLQSTNSFWLKFNFAQPFLLPYLFTMIKTKKFIDIIHFIATKFSKVLEVISIIGSIFGFGLVAVDYWYARKLGGMKRIALLLVSAIVLGALFYYGAKILFTVPALAPLFIPCLIGFVFLGFGGMSLVMLFGYGILSLLGLFADKQLCPALAPVLPGIPVPGLGIVIPFVGWISLFIVLVVHEMSHGILMSYYKQKINSVGLVLAGLFPIGAFVEQEDKTFDKLDDKKSLLVLSAGSASNLLLIPIGIILLLAFSLISAPFVPGLTEEQNKAYFGVRVEKVDDRVSMCGIDVNAPAKGKLFVGDIIKQTNGMDVNSLTALRTATLLSNGDINFLVSRKNVDTNLYSDVFVNITPNLFVDMNIKKIGADFGAIPTDYNMSLTAQAGVFLIGNTNMALLLLIIIAFAAGSFNYFPAEPFDGGKMGKIMMTPYAGFMKFRTKKETQKFIGRIFIWLLVISIILNLIPYLTLFF
jgi:hypothetical protein